MAIYDKPQAEDPLEELYRRGDRHLDRIRGVEMRKHLGVWVNPDFLNGWAWAGAPYHKYQYRLLFNDTLQTRGTIFGGGTGTVAFIVPELWRPVDGDVVWHGSVQGSTVPAQFRLSYTTGEVTVTY